MLESIVMKSSMDTGYKLNIIRRLEEVLEILWQGKHLPSIFKALQIVWENYETRFSNAVKYLWYTVALKGRLKISILFKNNQYDRRFDDCGCQFDAWTIVDLTLVQPSNRHLWYRRIGVCTTVDSTVSQASIRRLHKCWLNACTIYPRIEKFL